MRAFAVHEGEMPYNPAMDASVPMAGGLQEAAIRFARLWWLKALGFSLYMTAFMALYFALLRHPLFPVTLMPLVGLDHRIGFEPWSLLLYATLWLYISIVPSLLQDWSEARVYLGQVTLLSVAGFAIFLFYPTAVPPANIDWSAYPSVAFLKSLDASGNACPSMHAAFAALTLLWLHRLLRHLGAPLWLRLGNGLWCLGILYSILATKQHVALDLYAGVALGLAVALLYPAPKLMPVLQTKPAA